MTVVYVWGPSPPKRGVMGSNPTTYIVVARTPAATPQQQSVAMGGEQRGVEGCKGLPWLAAGGVHLRSPPSAIGP